jgi:hypothetical protein
VSALIAQVEQKLTEERTHAEEQRQAELKLAEEQRQAQEQRRLEEERDRAREAEEKLQASGHKLADAARGSGIVSTQGAGPGAQPITAGVERLKETAPIETSESQAVSTSPAESVTLGVPGGITGTGVQSSEQGGISEDLDRDATAKAPALPGDISSTLASAPAAIRAPQGPIPWPVMLGYALAVAVVAGGAVFTLILFIDKTAQDTLDYELYNRLLVPVELIVFLAFHAGLYFALGRWIALRCEQNTLPVALGTAILGLPLQTVPAILLVHLDLGDAPTSWGILLVLFTPFAFLGYWRGNKIRRVQDQARVAAAQERQVGAVGSTDLPYSDVQATPSRRQQIAAAAVGGGAILLTLASMFEQTDASSYDSSDAIYYDSNWFVPAFALLGFVAYLSTAWLLLSRFRDSGERRVAVLGGVYLFCGLLFMLILGSLYIIPLQVLITSALNDLWLWVYLQVGFALGAGIYLWSVRRQAGSPLVEDSGKFLLWLLLLVGGLLVVVLASLVPQVPDYLEHQEPVIGAVWVLQLLALGALIFVRRGQTTLDLWLTVAMTASLLGVTLALTKRSSVILTLGLGVNAGTNPVTFAVAHLDSLVAAAALLIMFGAQLVQQRRRVGPAT